MVDVNAELMFTVSVGLVILVEIPAPHKVMQGFIKYVDTVLGIFTVNEGFITYVESVLGT